VAEEIKAAAQAADEAPYPDIAELTTDVYFEESRS
jgi:TPP-dependent pyruvate/acetoin dehydrogenase alpha subunit